MQPRRYSREDTQARSSVTHPAGGGHGEKTIISDKVLLQLALVFCDQPTRVLTLGDIAQWTPGCLVQNTSRPTLGRVSRKHYTDISLKIFAGVLEILLTIAEQSSDEGREVALVNR